LLKQVKRTTVQKDMMVGYMRLFIAEKPNLGRVIADVLPKPHKKGDDYISAANGDTVSWCVGHLLEQQQPEAYDPVFKKWSHEHLPIIPQQWKLAVKKQTAKQLGVLRTLVKQAEQLVHAGDPDKVTYNSYLFDSVHLLYKPYFTAVFIGKLIDWLNMSKSLTKQLGFIEIFCCDNTLFLTTVDRLFVNKSPNVDNA
jgi:hypothetical protein